MDTMEQNNEMTAQQSLRIITETMNNNRMDIIRRGGKHFLLWGGLLTFFSLLVYALWKTTGCSAWNNLWFALPAIGFPLARWVETRTKDVRPVNTISRIVAGIWRTFGIFACAISLFTVLYAHANPNPIGTIVVGASLTAQIVLLFGMAEAVSGIALKNLAIRIAGYVTGIGGVILYYVTGVGKEQLLIFTLAGVVLFATGLIVRKQYK